MASGINSEFAQTLLKTRQDIFRKRKRKKRKRKDKGNK